MIETVTIYNGPNTCQRCLGWKRVDDGEGQSWKYWAELAPPMNISVQIGLVKPILCPDCEGTGQEPTNDQG